MRPIKWDGRERTAERIAFAMPDQTISWWGGMPGLERELFIRRRNTERKVPRGALVGKGRDGNPTIVRKR